MKSLEVKADAYLEPKRASTMQLFCEYTRCSTGLYIGHLKYWNFQSEAKLEQIIAIVTTFLARVSCYNLRPQSDFVNPENKTVY